MPRIHTEPGFGSRNPIELEVYEVAIVRRPSPFGELTTPRSATTSLTR
jgi:hypothetical protein